MPTASVYLNHEHYEKWVAVEHKRQWVEEHLDTDIQREVVFAEPPKEPNVPRPPFVSEFQWQQHLKDSGFVVTQ